jgi:hypothetical protein
LEEGEDEELGVLLVGDVAELVEVFRVGVDKDIAVVGARVNVRVELLEEEPSVYSGKGKNRKWANAILTTRTVRKVGRRRREVETWCIGESRCKGAIVSFEVGRRAEKTTHLGMSQSPHLSRFQP